MKIIIVAVVCLVTSCFHCEFFLRSCWANEQPRTIKVYTALDPTRSKYGIYGTESEAAFFITSGCYETLMAWNPEQQNYIPQLAKSWNIESPTRIVVRLREGVQFSNGKHMTSADVAESFKYLKAHAEFSRQMLSSIDKITTLDRTTFAIVLRHPDPLLLRRLSLWMRVFPCSDGYCDSLAANIRLSGTGRWRYLKREGRVFYFIANAQHWSGKVRPGTMLKVDTGATASLKDIKRFRGEPIVIDGLSWRERLEAKKDYGLNIIKSRTGYADYGIFNVLAKNSVIADLRVRMAINYAIDRKALVRIVYKELVNATPSISITSDDGHDDTLESYKYDPDEAKKLVQAYQKDNPGRLLEVRIGMQSGGEVYERFLKYFMTSLAQVGIKVTRNQAYNVARHKYDHKNAIDILIGGDPSPYGNFDFFVQNFFVKGSLFQMADDGEISSYFEEGTSKNSFCKAKSWLTSENNKNTAHL